MFIDYLCFNLVSGIIMDSKINICFILISPQIPKVIDGKVTFKIVFFNKINDYHLSGDLCDHSCSRHATNGRLRIRELFRDPFRACFVAKISDL